MPKTLFIDSTPDIDSVWKKVHGPSDIPVKVNMGPVTADAIPKLVQARLIERFENYDIAHAPLRVSCWAGPR